jgi:hypothetical protein
MNFIERRLNRRYIQSICLIILVTFVIALTVSFITQANGRTRFGSFLGADFAAFYVGGSIYNSFAPERIYDRALHNRLYRELFPEVPPGSELPYANTPFFILPFPLLAQFSYPTAYLISVLISIGLYVAGFSLIWRDLGAMPEGTRLTALLLALSFTPFLIECLAGGQTSAFGFFCLAIALRLERLNYRILSGAALAFCTYKPTLLLLIVPMLAITRSFRTLLGFAAGCLSLFFISLLAVGWQGCLNYVDTLLHFTSASTSAQSGLRSWKYVDINSFFRMLAGDHFYLRWALTFAFAALTLPALVKSWLRANAADASARSLCWSIAITWTLVLNLYLGIYDTGLVVLSALLAANLLYMKGKSYQAGLPSTFKYLLLLLYVVPLVTQLFAQITGIQLYTIVLAALGIYLLAQSRSVADGTSEKPAPAAVY